MPTVTNFGEKKHDPGKRAPVVVTYKRGKYTKTETVRRAYHHFGPAIFVDIAEWIHDKPISNKTEQNWLKRNTTLLLDSINNILDRIPWKGIAVCSLI